ncbi:hypothetical protein BGLT_05184 [Caballeronia glathei]|uniref:Uncharacterized protein n=1 Tax=Caballeronia glathei TaxID=60547 RepID=A0A069PH58_9BURK|nr:hypothetical protein [Caballeronia glathei]KDR39204.1 hypothetical protein BG61_34210 [Caballeronia glathei]CDY76112.1 hypothetical protein BGLT_05184 [Caballeronia glathei]
MAELIDFSNIGKGIDSQMANAALSGQQIGLNAATAPSRIQATNAANAATVSNSGLQIANNQRQQAFQMESQALASNPNAQPADYQALAVKYPEFAQTVNQNTNQAQTNWANIRQRMSSDAVSTVAGMQARLQANDPNGALELLEARAVRQENSGDAAGAAQTRSFEALITKNPEQAKQVASQILNAGSANTADQLYANQTSQARAVVAQNTVPAAVAQANADASRAGTAAAYAPQQAEAGIQSTQAGTGLTTAQTGVTNQQLIAPPAAIAAAQPEYTAGQTNQQLADQAGELAGAFNQVESGGTSGVLGATWDNAGRKWTGDTSKLQQLRQEAASVVVQGEVASMVNGNFTDASTARAAANVPTITDGPKAWATYLQARQKFLASKAAWSNARGDWARSNNASFGPAYRDFTIQTPDGNAVLVKSGDSFTKFAKKVAPTYYTAPGENSFDPTK